ncbi:MAG: hypothetical protein IJG83_05635 [Thermoguttaceae bacterium]|nr:hypothetical protein [Thermoguttaceae bacterium]
MSKRMLFNIDKALKSYPVSRHGEALVRSACFAVAEETSRTFWPGLPTSPQSLRDCVDRRHPEFYELIRRIITDSTRAYPRARARARCWLTPQRVERLKEEAVQKCCRKRCRRDLSA